MGRKKGSKNKPQITLTGVKTSPGGFANPHNMFSIGSSAGSGFQKTAHVGNAAAVDVTQTSSFFYSPELTTESWLLPKSRQEILKWARIFFNLEPYVQQVIEMHQKYPFSDFVIESDDPSGTEFYKEMADNKDFSLFDFILQASLSYQKFGEAIPFGSMEKGDDGYWRWVKFILLEPELVEIESDLFTGDLSFELIPPKELQALVKSTDKKDADRKGKLEEEAPEVVNAIREGRNIRLSEENVSIIARLTDPSATRGTSPIQCLFKVLIYQDWIRLAQSAFAQRYIFPIELWTIGDLAEKIIPTEEDLERFRGMINQQVQNPPFTLMVPPYVKYEPLSTLGKQFPINNEYDYIHDQLLAGLGVNKNIILGEGPSFSNVKTMALHKLIMMYRFIRKQFEGWMINKFFRPIAEKNEFYTMHEGKRKLILPTINWNKSLDVEEENEEKERYISFWKDGLISTKTLLGKFPGIEHDKEQQLLEDEIGTVFDKGDKRLPKKVGKPKGGAGGAGGPTGPAGDAGAGPVPPEPIEPQEPTEEGAPGEEVPEGEGPDTIPEGPAEGGTPDVEVTTP